MNTPNVLLVVLDTARADYFGPYGGRAPTPAFDAIAARGLIFERAWAAAPWTVPSHASLFSGLLPFEHGVTGAAAQTPERRLATVRPAVERHAERWLPEVFRRSGYRTVAISANVWITPAMGFDLGFEEFTPVGMARVTPRGAAGRRRLRDCVVPASLLRQSKRSVRYFRDARRGRDFGAEAALAAARSLTEPSDRPFLAFVNVMETHAPYLPPEGFNPLRGLRRLGGPRVMHKYLGDERVLAYNLGAAEVPERALATMRELYAGEVAYVDAFLGRLLNIIEPVLGETVVVVTSDHGENLGEEHRLGHQLFVDERLVRVPLVVAGPGVTAGRREEVFSLASLPRLVAGLAGLGSHQWADAIGHGIAIAQYESGWNQVRRADRVTQRFHLSPAQQERLRAPAAAATDGRTTVVRDAAGERVDGPPGGAERLRSALDASGSAPAEREGAVSPAEEAEIEERLRDLGYL